MSFCIECGTALTERELEHEGVIPYYPSCESFRFPQYNVAMSAIVYDEKEESILLIQQYGQQRNILVAGYVSRGEKAEETVIREIKEETGLDVEQLQFNASYFYEKNNVLMLNFVCRIKKAADLNCNHEIDKAAWFTPAQAKEAIYRPSIVQYFLDAWLDKGKKLD